MHPVDQSIVVYLGPRFAPGSVSSAPVAGSIACAPGAGK